jgi:hypothetical protein
MRIQNSKLWVRYSFGDAAFGTLTLVLCAFLIRFFLQPLIEPYAPFHFFIVACLFIAYFYGYKWALLATLVSSVLGSYFFVKPYFTLGPASVSDVIQFVNFTSVTAIAILIIERLRRNAYGRQMVLKVMESRQKISLYRENDRIYFSKKNNESWAILEEILVDFDDIIFLKFAGGSIKLEPLFLELTQSDLYVLKGDDWRTLIHPEDLPVLLAKLHDAAMHPGYSSEFEMRFTQAEGVLPTRVRLEAYAFLGKPLKILRRCND